MGDQGVRREGPAWGSAVVGSVAVIIIISRSMASNIPN